MDASAASNSNSIHPAAIARSEALVAAADEGVVTTTTGGEWMRTWTWLSFAQYRPQLAMQIAVGSVLLLTMYRYARVRKSKFAQKRKNSSSNSSSDSIGLISPDVAKLQLASLAHFPPPPSLAEIEQGMRSVSLRSPTDFQQPRLRISQSDSMNVSWQSETDTPHRREMIQHM
jgi:hypothetical protein